MASTIPSGESDKEHPKGPEYECLLDIKEKEDFAAEKQESYEDDTADVEAAHPNVQAPTESPQPKRPRAPLTHDERLALRIKPMDNIRTITFCTIFIYNAAIQAVTSHKNPQQVHETDSKTFIIITLFSVFVRLLAVPMLFFVAGFTSHFSMVMHARSPIQFVVRRTWKTALAVLFYQGTARLAMLIIPLPSVDTASTTPYYATREGIQAVLNGPTFYVVAVLALDYIYALFRSINLFIAGDDKPTPLIRWKGRYLLVKYTLFIGMECWIGITGCGLYALFPRVSAVVEPWIHASNAAELHFPFLFIIAYMGGVHFVHYYKYILERTPRSKDSKCPSRFSPTSVFFIRVTLSTLVLTLLLSKYRFASTLMTFFDVRLRPALAFSDRFATPSYILWALYVVSVLPEATIALFFTSRTLAGDWGNFSRYAHAQVYVQMLYVLGNPIRFFEGVFARWLFIVWMGMWYAHYGSIGAVGLGNLVVRGWKAVKARFAKKEVQPIQV
ncbi:hypothetical protein BDN70DRAFT_885491 [Pholiota conissans]|uniref:Uncharacterized protein n=1 Tax=Pholiota conissans TaxID=109636 RepID=A0A9P5YQY2_9AGAR|nr:hypothetical protein BDN70DRAFT_885491 [Pholiota conissans]